MLLKYLSKSNTPLFIEGEIFPTLECNSSAFARNLPNFFTSVYSFVTDTYKFFTSYQKSCITALVDIDFIIN